MSSSTRNGPMTPPPSTMNTPQQEMPAPAPDQGHGGDHQGGDTGLLVHLLGHQGLLGHAGWLGLAGHDGLLDGVLGHGGHGDVLDIHAHVGLDLIDWDHGW